MSGKLTRRTVLAHTPVAVAAAGLLAVPAIGAASDAEPLLAVWREYWPLETELKAVTRRRNAIIESLPEEVRRPRVHYATYNKIERGAKGPDEPLYAYFDSDIDGLAGPIPGGPGPDYMERRAAWRAQLKRELAEAVRAARIAEERAGVTALWKRGDWLCNRTEPLAASIQKDPAIGPAGYAVKILTALAWTDDGADFLVDLPHCISVSLLRDLLPHLPDDLAAVARRVVSHGEMTTIDEALFRSEEAV